MQTRLGIVLGCLVLAMTVGCNRKPKPTVPEEPVAAATATADAATADAAANAATADAAADAATADAAANAATADAGANVASPKDSRECMRDDYDPRKVYPLSDADASETIVVRKLDAHLRPYPDAPENKAQNSVESDEGKDSWFQIAVTQENDRVRCAPEWRDRFSVNQRYDGPYDVPIPEICEYRCKLGLAGTEFVGDKPVCRTPYGDLDMPKDPSGYRCFDNDNVLARAMIFRDLEDLYVSGKAPWEKDVDAEDEEEREQLNVWNLLDDSVPGYVCSAEWPDRKPECLCGGQNVPFGTVCNDDQIVAKCTDAAGCDCGGKKIGTGMYCDRGKAYCGVTEITDGITGAVCRHGILICNDASCAWNGSTVSKGTAMLGEKPRFHACLDKNGCTVNGESVAYQSVVFGDKTYQKVSVSKGMPYCGSAAMYENAKGLTCKDDFLRCEADSCPYGKHVLSRGILVEGDSFVCEREGGCTVDGKPLCGRKPKPEVTYCKDADGKWSLSPERELYCAGIRGNGTLARTYMEWVCAEPDKQTYTDNDRVPTISENGFYYNGQSVLCGAQQIPELHFYGDYGTCRDGVFTVKCGDLPEMKVDDAQSFPFTCWNETALRCMADSCTLGERQMKRDEVCNGKRCLPLQPIPESASEHECSGEDSCCDYAMGTSGCGPYLGQDEWMSLLLASDVEVCIDGNCKCGKGVCGKMGVCKNGECYCGSMDEPTPPKKGSDQCVAFKREFESTYGRPKKTIDMIGAWLSGKACVKWFDGDGVCNE